MLVNSHISLIFIISYNIYFKINTLYVTPGPWLRTYNKFTPLTSGLTPLHQAVLDGNLGAVTLLVAHGADINKQDDDSWTPLHAACAEGYADIVGSVF